MNPTAGDVHVNRPLTNISIAFIQDQNMFVADRVFPNIPVMKQSDRYFVYEKGDFFRNESRERAPGTESAGGSFRVDNTPTYFAKPFALHYDIADQIRANADQPLNLERDATTYITQQLLLGRERRWINSFFTTGVWDDDLVGGVDFTQWDDATSTPIEDITSQALQITGRTGVRPNTLVLGPEVYNALKNHADVLDRIKYTQRGIVTTDILASLFDVEQVLVAWAVENSAGEGLPNDIDYIAGKNAFLCYSNPSPSILTPSAGYTFSWTGYLGAGQQGNRIKRFRMEHLSSDRIEGEFALDQKVVASELGSFFSNAVS